MSQQVFPTLQGLSWEYKKIPTWSTIKQTGATGVETRLTYWTYPIYQIDLTYNFLTDSSFSGVNSVSKSDLESIIALYNIVGGSFDDFLYQDKVDNAVTNEAFATGNGSTKTFQLTRTVNNEWVEPIFGLNGTPIITIDNVATTAFTVNNYGLVTFTNAPANGKIIRWTGGYYFRCRFLNDTLTFQGLMKGLWDKGIISLTSVKIRQ